ncbi:MAG: peptidoglycan editing factor PgeF [Clostridiales bacterium]|nr:peptidoglycan editing factor PgeF [Clostridiales bacterium]
MAGKNWRRNKWTRNRNQGVEWMEDGFLTDTGLVRQGFIARGGGVSAAPYDSLNLSFGSGDDVSAVMENRRRAEHALRFPLVRWACVHQVHGIAVRQVSGMDAGQRIPGPEILLPEADAMITDEAGVILVTLHADCLPIYVLDPQQPAIGLAHAGWRGTLANIAGALVRAMQSAFGSRPSMMLAAIGPGAGPCHYEVGEPVLGKAEERFGAFPEALSMVLRPSPNPGRAYLDMEKANALLLEQSGIPAGQISLAETCTICENRRFFSYRMQDKGRQAAFFSFSTPQ